MRILWLLVALLARASAMFESEALRTLGLRRGATKDEIKRAYCQRGSTVSVAADGRVDAAATTWSIS